MTDSVENTEIEGRKEAAFRVDFSPIPRVAATAEGYLRGEAVVTRTGVFTYRNNDGSVRRELRHPADVFHADSLASLKMIPLTVDHPTQGLVTAENSESLSVGMTGENSRVDNSEIIAPFTVTHKRGIAAVKAGKKELSLGYSLDLVREDGVYNGEAYTHRQTNIKYNHLAIVDNARAGRTARINMDGFAVQDSQTANEDVTMTEKTLAKVNLDGLVYEASPEVARALEKAQADLAKVRTDSENEKAELQRNADKLQARVDEMQADVEKHKALNTDEAIGARVTAKLALIEKAKRIINKDSGDLTRLSDRSVMVEAIQHRHPDIKLDGKSDDYIQARFDSIVDSLPDECAANQRQATGVKPGATVNADSVEETRSALENMYKGAK